MPPDDAPPAPAPMPGTSASTPDAGASKVPAVQAVKRLADLPPLTEADIAALVHSKMPLELEALVDAKMPADLRSTAYPRLGWRRAARWVLRLAWLGFGAYLGFAANVLVPPWLNGQPITGDLLIEAFLLGRLQPLLHDAPLAALVAPAMTLLLVVIAGRVAHLDLVRERDILAKRGAWLTRAIALERERKRREPEHPSAPVASGPPFEQNSLPVPEKEFVGRQTDLDWLLPRLRVGGATAITAIDGLPGVGKSTLAGVAATWLYEEGQFPDGIAVADCLGRVDAVGVLRDALDGFAPEEAQKAANLDALATVAASHLTGRRALIVFDNVEPDLNITAVLQRLRPTGVTVLLTARQRLPVPPDATLELALLAPGPALDLFAEWYGQADAAALTPGEWPAAERIVKALGRHTLAIKLAGGEAGYGVQQLADRTPASIERWLTAFAAEKEAHPLDLQGLGDDPTLALKDNFMRSVQKLPTDGDLGDVRRLFTALAAFVAPAPTPAGAQTDASEPDRVRLVPSLEFGREAAIAVAEGLELPAPSRAVDLLVRRALLDKVTDTALPEDSDRERLRLHPLLRELAAELLDDATRAAASLAIATFYAEYANATPDNALGPDAATIAGALEWAHASAPDDARDALVAGMCEGMRQFWDARSRTHDSLRYLPWGIAAAERIAGSDDREDHLLLARLQLAYATALITAGRLRQAEEYINASIEIRRSADDVRGEGIALSLLGDILVQRGELAAAQANYERVLAIMGEVGDRREEGVALYKIAVLAEAGEDLDRAERLLRESLKLAKNTEDRLGVADSFQGLGRFLIQHERGESAEGCTMLRQAIAIYHKLGVPDEQEARELAAVLGCDAG